MALVTVGPNPPEQTSNAQLPDQLQDQGQSGADITQANQPPMRLDPAAAPITASSPNRNTHNFIGRATSALFDAIVGKDGPSYTVDSATGKMTAQAAPPMTAGQKLRRLADTFGTGLAAGANIPQQKSGLASALAGLGAGFGAESQKLSDADRTAQGKAKEDFERQQQEMLHKAELAKGNALVYTTLAHAHREQIDRNEIYGMGKAAVTAMEAENIPVERLSGDQLATRFHETPQQLLTEGKILPIGEQEMSGPNGEPIVDPATGGPRFERLYAYVPGMHTDREGGPAKFKLPKQFSDYVAKYAPYATGTKLSGGDLTKLENAEVDIRDFNRLHNAAAEGQKAVLQGRATPDAVEGANGTIFEKNTITGEMRPASQARVDAYMDRKEKREHLQKENQKLDAEIAKLKKEGSEETSDIGSQGQDLVEGDMDPTQIQKRGKTYNAVVQAARVYSLKKYGKPFDMAQAQADYNFATDPKTQNRLKYVNSLTGDPRTGDKGNLDLLIDYSNKVNRTEFPALNNAEAWLKLETGDTNIVKLRNAALDAADQFANIMRRWKR